MAVALDCRAMSRMAVWVGAVACCGACASPATAPPLLVDPGATNAHPDLGTPQTWRPAPAAAFIAAEMQLLTDGTVIVQELSTENWWRLTPDANGDYGSGTWTQIASMQAGYSPLYWGGGVLPDGKVIVMGGEYLAGNFAFTTMGSLYDPVADQWTAMHAPPGWTSIGDASGMVLANGTFLLSDCCTSKQALLDERSLTWTATGAGKQDINDEESWAMLPDGTILTVDTNNVATLTQAELYTPATGEWTSAGKTPVQISDTNPNSSGTHEIGPEVLRYDGTVLALGGNGHNVVYDTKTGTWSAAPDLPVVGGQQLAVADGPGALLPNGNVLFAAAPGFGNPPASFWEWDGASFTPTAATPNAGRNSSYEEALLVLPTGEILATDYSPSVQIYTPAPGHPDNAVPVITEVPQLIDSATGRVTEPHRPLAPATDGAGDQARGVAERALATLDIGRTYLLTGDRLNGLTQGAYYGDDEQMYTNYPLVRVTNTTTHHVRYCRTHEHSSRSIAPDTHSTTQFDIPADAEPGLATLEVIANGIASPTLAVNLR